MTAPTPFNIAPTLAPSSSTGSDLHELIQETNFGDVSFGPKPLTGTQKIIQQVAIGLAVAVGAKFIMEAIKK